MQKWPKLQFPPIRLRIQRSEKGLEVWDGQRSLWLKLTPEEWVRRHVLGWLERCGVALERVAQEYRVPLNGQWQRADIVVMDQKARPWLVVECKAPGVKLSNRTLDQVVRYNSVINAPYLMITNGMVHYFYRLSENQYKPMHDLPAWQELQDGLKNE